MALCAQMTAFMQSKAWRLGVVLLGAVTVMQIQGCSIPKRQARNVEGWTTHCFGRYLVDLPPSAKIKAVYTARGDDIRYLPGETPQTLISKVSKRQAELEAQKQSAENGSMLVSRMQHGDRGSVSLLSWKGRHSKHLMKIESYFIATSPWQVFASSGDVSVDRIEIAKRNADAIASNISSREPHAIPEGPGFCIEGGFIAGNEFQDESFRVGIEFPEHPNAQIFINASTGAEENKLLDRTGGFLLSLTRALLPGMNVLRKGGRNVGPIEAQEFATAASGRGQRLYAFAWEAQGRDNSLADQNVAVRLQVLEQFDVTESRPYQPAFESDEEALQLWDGIVDSVRLRPGAV